MGLSGWETGPALVPLAIRGALAAIFFYLYRRRRDSYLLYWTLGWALLALHPLTELHWGEAGEGALLPGLSSLVLGLAFLLFLDAARSFAQGSVPTLATVLLTPVFVVWLGLGLLFPGLLERVPMELGSGVAAALAGTVFWQESSRRESGGGKVLAAGFLLWGLLLLGTPIPLVREAFTSYPALALNLPLPLVGFGMLIALYERDRGNIEGNILRLAGLNLLTSTAEHAGTAQEMLGQALERLLGALRIPTGTVAVLGLHSQFRCIHRGNHRSGSFLREMEHQGLIPYLHQTVARLGGLVVFPEFSRPSELPPFVNDPEFERVSVQAHAEGVRQLLGVSLRAKSENQGLLLLASPELRHFTPAELRLLVGLGGQVGMAVENFRLSQQSARRAEELRLLNEIGRTISSTLNLDELLRRVHGEVQKVLDVSNFYIALYDHRNEIVRFELEVKEGRFLPKQQRRARNGLTEYVVRHQQPLLIPNGFGRVTAELGVEPGRNARSFCAVPILLHGEALGVIGVVNYAEENSFDAGDVEILTILAAQVAVAIENARLFEEEQRRARQLTLLNNVSRKAISTLNPEEMLAAIAQEIHGALPYDHVGLGLLDYANREVVIQAEAGQSAQSVNLRLKLGEGSVGRVAQAASLEQFENLQENPGSADVRPVLPDAKSLLCLPILYGDHLMGVLNVESRRAYAFAEEDVLLLRTLADLIASALHNAFLFQKAQEQAITDGLTGVKTHRFFMEALTREWRRATRVNRSFSLLLLDLDRFKLVNDYFGHLEGDTMLQRVGRVLEQHTRRSDVVARYGGDEFVVLMPETNAEQAYRLGDKLRQYLANDPLLREKQITASIGVATYPQHAATPQELIQIADASMYLSKHQGGNNIVSAEHYKLSEEKEWQRSVLEAYLGVTLKRLFSTGPDAFNEFYERLEQVVRTLGTAPEESEVPPPALETVTALASAIDAKDHYTQGHSQNVAHYCTLAARHLQLPEKEVEELRLAAILHDVGKIGIPERILNKPAGLDSEEWRIMKEHSVLGAKILEPLRSLPRIQKIVRHHHERWDGTGYPDGLPGEATPLGARLLAIADAYDTMVGERVYRPARSRSEAFEELRRCAGSQFDPQLVEAFLEAVSKETPAPAESRT